MKLYKYKALPYKKDNLNEGELKQVEYCKDIILNNRLFMTPREILNDPLEGMAVPIELGISGSGIYASLGMLHPFVEEKINQYRILSLSANARSPLMWAHYANNYAGVCFEFELYRNQRIISGNAQFTGITAGQGVGFTTGLLLLREGLGMRETPIRPHS